MNTHAKRTFSRKSKSLDRRHKTTRSRLWLFRIVAITVVPFFFFTSLEVGLRLSGFGHPASYTITSEINGRTAVRNNDAFIYLFFPPKLARPSIPFAIPVEKSAKTYRIFILGGSAAQGDPEPTFGVARILEVLLQDQYPETEFEVINAAVTAINSHVVLQVVKDLVQHQPDLFILYLGNNEVVGPFGAGSVFSPLFPSLSLIRASILLKSTRVGQALTKVLQTANKKDDMPKKWGGMEMFLEKQVRADDPALEIVYHNFQRNLEDILDVAQKAEIMTIVSTVGINLKDNAPFSSLHRRDLSKEEEKAWNHLYQSGMQLESQDRYAKAIEQYLEAVLIDNSYADLHYRLGKCYWELGDYKTAWQRYVRALDLDTLRFRADTRINNIIRTVTKSKRALLADAAQNFQNDSPDKIVGKELFYDHVHMNFKGNYILAKSLFQQIATFFPNKLRRAKNRAEILSVDECGQRLAYTGYDRQRVAAEVLRRFEKPPFTNQVNHRELLEQAKQNLEELEVYTQPRGLAEADNQYDSAIQRHRSDPWLHYNYAQLLQASGNLESAAEQLASFTLHLPQYAPAYEQLAEILIEQGKFGEAIARCKQVLQFNPGFSPIYYHLAFALAKQGNFVESIQKYRDLIKLTPEKSSDIYNQIGKIYVHLGRLGEAEKVFQQAIDHSESKKSMPDIHFNLAYVLKRSNKTEEAARELQKAIEGYVRQLERNPGSSETHLVLAQALAEHGDYEEATKHLFQARDLHPSNLSRHQDLIRFLERQGRLDEAIEAARNGMNFMLHTDQKEAATFLRAYLQSLEAKKSRIDDRE